jgi:hypothetical protein
LAGCAQGAHCRESAKVELPRRSVAAHESSPTTRTAVYNRLVNVRAHLPEHQPSARTPVTGSFERTNACELASRRARLRDAVGAYSRAAAGKLTGLR